MKKAGDGTGRVFSVFPPPSKKEGWFGFELMILFDRWSTETSPYVRNNYLPHKVANIISPTVHTQECLDKFYKQTPDLKSDGDYPG